MSRPRRSVEAAIAEYWSWFAVGLFLLVTVDLLTTMGAFMQYGPAAEANPLVRWTLRQGPAVVAAVNLGVVVVAAVAFSGVLEAVRAVAPDRSRYLTYALEAWLGLLVAIGLFIFANNLAVIVLGDSLV